MHDKNSSTLDLHSSVSNISFICIYSFDDDISFYFVISPPTGHYYPNTYNFFILILIDLFFFVFFVHNYFYMHTYIPATKSLSKLSIYCYQLTIYSWQVPNNPGPPGAGPPDSYGRCIFWEERLSSGHSYHCS